MKSFITGGAGFIGSALVERLLNEGHTVIVYDNMSTGKSEFLKKFGENSKFKFVKGNLLDFNKLKKSMKGADFVWHLAANADVKQGVENTKLDLEQGVLTTYNVLEAMRQNSIKKIAFSSSSVVYGEAKKIPTPEDYGPLVPVSFYGASKLSAEAEICAFCGSFDFTAYIFRFANVIGRNATHGILADFLKKIKQTPDKLEVLGDGTQKKSYILVDDCVDAMIHVTKTAKEKVNIYNIGSQDQISVKRIAELFIEQSGSNAKIVYTGGKRGWAGDVPNMMLSTRKLSTLGWKTRHTSEDAVKLTIRYILTAAQ